MPIGWSADRDFANTPLRFYHILNQARVNDSRVDARWASVPRSVTRRASPLAGKDLSPNLHHSAILHRRIMHLRIIRVAHDISRPDSFPCNRHFRPCPLRDGRASGMRLYRNSSSIAIAS